MNKVKDFNLTFDNPQYSPNPLEELEQNIHKFEVENIERIVTTKKPSPLVTNRYNTNTNFLYLHFKDLTSNEQAIPQIKLISL